jgi:hypothetical protein
LAKQLFRQLQLADKLAAVQHGFIRVRWCEVAQKHVRKAKNPTDLKLLAEIADLFSRQLGGDDTGGRELLRKLGLRARDTT